MRILIGYDGSEASYAMVTDLRRAGLSGRAEALVLTAAELAVLPPRSGYMPDGGGIIALTTEEVRRSVDSAAERARTTATTGAKHVAELFPSWEVRTVSPVGPPDAALLEEADRWRPDLLVVGSHGRSALGRLVFGSVARSVLSHAPCTVRVARGGAPSTEKPLGFPLRLLVGVDGSAQSGAAVDAVCRRGWPPGTEVRLVTVHDLRIAMMYTGFEEAAFWPDPIWSDDSPVERAVRAAGERFKDTTLNVSTVVLEGDPKCVLLDEAQRWGPDSIYVGARGHSRWERFLLGSVSSSVAARAGCSVEVVRKAGKE